MARKQEQIRVTPKPGLKVKIEEDAKERGLPVATVAHEILHKHYYPKPEKK